MLTAALAVERWPLREPFVIARDVMTDVPVLHVTLTGADGRRGQAEAAGVDYDGETPESMAAGIRAVAGALGGDFDAPALASLLPAGGARNALDCALWDLRAKREGLPVWQLAGLARAPEPVTTAFTIGLKIGRAHV